MDENLKPAEPPALESRSAEVRNADGRLEHPQVRYETRDVQFRWILAVLLVAAGLFVVEYFVIWRVFRNREQHSATTKASPYALAPLPVTSLPEEPRLEQIDRLAGIEGSHVFDRETASTRLLATYGRTPEKGYIRIPIQRAMQLVLPDLPVRKQESKAGPPKDDGLLYFGDSNSGRVFRETP